MKKRFDCVEAKHRAQERIVEETAGMSVEEELAYWRHAEAAWQEERKGKPQPAAPAPPHAK